MHYFHESLTVRVYLILNFDGVLQREDNGTHEFAPASICSNAKHSDVDSFYSDAELSYGNNNDDVDDIEPDNDDNGSDGDDDYSSDESDFSDGTYLASDTDDSLIYDFEEEELSSSDDKDNLPNYTPRPFPDDHVPFSENIYLIGDGLVLSCPDFQDSRLLGLGPLQDKKSCKTLFGDILYRNDVATIANTYV